MRRIIIDTREQRPWGFPLCDVTVQTLKTGDYALEGDGQFAIERKSKDDLLGTLSTGWHRFVRELNRMDDAEFTAQVLIAECHFEELCFSERNGEIIPPDHEHYRLSPQFLMKRIAELTLRGVNVIFAGNAALAANLAYRILLERNTELDSQQNLNGESHGKTENQD